MGLGKRMTGWEAVLMGVFGALASVLAVGLTSNPASAGNWLNFKAGDNQVYFHQCDLRDKTHDAFHNNSDHDILPTDINPHQYHGCDTVDVRINDGQYFDESAYGWYECHDDVDRPVCDHGHVHINSKYDFLFNDNGTMLSLVCEEIGHSVGLAHRPSGDESSCMSQRWESRHLDSHDTNTIDNHYG